MKVAFINKSDLRGGAAVVTFRLMEALRRQGVDARMIVTEKLSDNPNVSLAGSKYDMRKAFIRERLRIFKKNGFKKSTLFQIDTSTHGLRLSEHPWVKEADVVCLSWINQGMLSLEEIGKIMAPVVWTMHDMWNFTGVCHHAGECQGWRQCCGYCPLFPNGGTRDDESSRVWKRKRKLYEAKEIHFVGVSNWLGDLARESGLLCDQDVSVIGNAFPVKETDIEENENLRHGLELQRSGKIRLLMGASRLDDPIKGLPLLIKATNILCGNYPEIADKMELYTFGAVKNPDAFKGLKIRHLSLGVLRGKEAIKNAYLSSDIVVSSSLYETLPGTMVEGQAYGCVPVSFNRGGQADIIEDGVTGVICRMEADAEKSALNLAEGIVKATKMLGIETRKKMANSVIDKFSSTAIAKRYIDLFEKILQNKT